MYSNEEAKREYFRNRYRTQKERYKKNQSNYWKNYAIRKLGKEDVTEEEIKHCKNQYYKEYRDTHKEEVEQINNKFWENKAKELNNEN